MKAGFLLVKRFAYGLVTLLLVGCKEQTLIGELTVSEGFRYTDSQQVSQQVDPGRYTAYLKPQPGTAAGQDNGYRFTLVENGKPPAATRVLHIPVYIPGTLAWRNPDGKDAYPLLATPPAELAEFSGSAYLPAGQFNQPFNLQFSVVHHEYGEKMSVKRDCKVSVAAFDSDVGFEHYYYFDGRSFQPGRVRGPVQSLSLKFTERPSYKKISYSESGREFVYGLQLKAPETQQLLAAGNATLRVPLHRSQIRESGCRPVR